MKNLFAIIIGAMLCFSMLACRLTFIEETSDADKSLSIDTTSAFENSEPVNTSDSTVAIKETTDVVTTEGINDEPLVEDTGYLTALDDIINFVKKGDFDSAAKIVYDPYYLAFVGSDAASMIEQWDEYKYMIGSGTKIAYNINYARHCNGKECSTISDFYNYEMNYGSDAIEDVVLLSVEFFFNDKTGVSLTNVFPALKIDGNWYINVFDTDRYVVSLLCELTVERVAKAIEDGDAEELCQYIADPYYVNYRGETDIVAEYASVIDALTADYGNSLRVNSGKNNCYSMLDDYSESGFDNIVSWYNANFGYPTDAFDIVALYEYDEFSIKGNNATSTNKLDLALLFIEGEWYISPLITQADMYDCVIDGNAMRLERYFKAICDKDTKTLYDLIVDSCNYEYMLLHCNDKAGIIDSYNDYEYFAVIENEFGENTELCSYDIKSYSHANEYSSIGVEALSNYLVGEFDYTKNYINDVVFAYVDVCFKGDKREGTLDMDFVMLGAEGGEEWYISDAIYSVGYAKALIDDAQNGEVYEEQVIDYSGYVNAKVGSYVIIDSYVQGKQALKDGTASLYLQDEDGGIFVSEIECSPKEYESIDVGNKIRVYGYKEEYEGACIITNALVEVVDGYYVAEPLNVTHLLGSDSIADYKDCYVSFDSMVVELVEYESSDTFGDIYLSVSKDGEYYSFKVEHSLTDENTDVYNTVSKLSAGDVVNIDGFLRWSFGVNTHVTGIESVVQ